MLHNRNVAKAQNYRVPGTIFPQNNCIYSYYVHFQDSVKRVSANRVSANRDWTGLGTYPSWYTIQRATTVRNAMRQWSVSEQNRLWCLTPECRQAKSMLKGIDLSLSRYALRLTRRYLRILIGLLTGHADLNQLTPYSDESQVGPYLSPLSRGRRNCSSSPWKMQRTVNY